MTINELIVSWAYECYSDEIQLGTMSFVDAIAATISELSDAADYCAVSALDQINMTTSEVSSASFDIDALSAQLEELV